MNSLYLPTSSKKQIVIVTARVTKEKNQAFKQFLLLIFTPVLGLSHEATAHLLEIRVLFCCHFLLLLFVEKELTNPASHVQGWNSDHSTIMRLLLLSTYACCNNRTNKGRKPGAVQKYFGSETDCLIIRKIWKWKPRYSSHTASGISMLPLSRYVLTPF